jgi:hypothetical protein
VDTPTIMPALFGIPEKELNVLNFASNLQQSADRQRHRWRGE